MGGLLALSGAGAVRGDRLAIMIGLSLGLWFIIWKLGERLVAAL